MLEQLAEIEKRLEAAEVESCSWGSHQQPFNVTELIVGPVRKSYLTQKPLYDERTRVVEKIPGFWPAVFAEAPAVIEDLIQARDTPLLQHLTSLEVSRFELDENPEKGDPRSIQFTFRFDANEYFHDRTLVKRFWHRESKDGRSGLVSEPLPIQWKEGKDVTDGLLDFAIESYRLEKERTSGLRLQQHVNKGKIKTQLHGENVSIFTWFGYRGRNFSAAESAKIGEDGKNFYGEPEAKVMAGNGNDDERYDHAKPFVANALPLDEDEEGSLSNAIFPAGEELAIAISDDLYPGAVKYFGNSSDLPLATFLLALKVLKCNTENKRPQIQRTKMMTRQRATCQAVRMIILDVQRSASKEWDERDGEPQSGSTRTAQVPKELCHPFDVGEGTLP